MKSRAGHMYSLRGVSLWVMAGVLSIASPALAAPTLTPIAPQAAVSPAWGDQATTSISTGADTQLVVWADDRANVTASYEGETSHDIYGQLLDSGGQALGAPFPVTQWPGSQTNPRAVWNGQAWLVLFQSAVLSGTGYYYSAGVAAVRVSNAGEVVDDAPIPFYGLESGAWQAAGTADGWVLTYQGTSVSEDLGVMRISQEGEVLDPPTITLVPETHYVRSNIRLAHAQGVSLLTWHDDGVTYGLRFDETLTPTDNAPWVIVEGSLRDLRSNGEQFFLLWHRYLPDSSAVVTGATLSPTGSQVDGEVNISRSRAPQANTVSQVSWDGAYWWATWGYDDLLRVARITDGLDVLDPGGRAVEGPLTGLTAGLPGGGVSVVWNERAENSDRDVYGAAIDEGFAPSDNQALSISAPQQLNADMAWGPGGPVVAFRADDGATSAVQIMPLDATGAARWASPMTISAAAAVGSPAIDWAEDHFLVAWGTEDGIMATRLDASSQPIDDAPWKVMDAFGPVDVAANGQDALVVGHRFGITIQTLYPVATRVRGADVLDAAAFTVGGSYTHAVRAAPLGDQWVVVTLRKVTHDDTLAFVNAQMVNSDGSLGETLPCASPGAVGGGNFIYTLGLAGGPDAALLVQSAEVTSGVETDLIGQLIYADGSVGAAFNLTPWVGNQYRPEVASGRDGFVVTYQDQRHRDTRHALEQLDARSDIMAIRVGADGAQIDPMAAAISTASTAESHATVACDDQGCVAVASLLGGEGYNYQVSAAALSQDGAQPPVLVPTADPTTGTLPLLVHFSAGDSYDPDGGPLQFTWHFGDGATANGPEVSHTYHELGPYTVSLAAQTPAGASGRNTVSVAPSVANIPPVAHASADVTSGPAPLSVVFKATGSYDPDGAVGNVKWTYGDGTPFNYGPTAYHTYSEPGTYVATVTVFDAVGASSEDTITIEVGEINLPPTAVLAADPIIGESPLTVDFSALGSSDPEGDPLTYVWIFGDGASAEGAEVSHTFETGTWETRLTVTDIFGHTDSETVLIIVEEPAGGCDTSRLPSEGSDGWQWASVFAMLFATRAWRRRETRE